jgi:hypothetical protein
VAFRWPPLLGGDLNPISGFCFPLFSRVLPRGISIRVETCGSERKQKCGKLWSIYVQIFYVFCGSLPFHGDVENPIRLCAQRQSCAARFPGSAGRSQCPADSPLRCRPCPNSLIAPAIEMAGFRSAPSSEPVIELADFAKRRYRPTVSRLIPNSLAIRRCDHPRSARL